MKIFLTYAKLFIDSSKKDGISDLAAQLTYRLILAFFPFLIFLVSLIGYTGLSGLELIAKLNVVFPKDTYDTVVDIMSEVILHKNSSFISLGMISSILIASGGISSIMKGLNRAYNITETRKWIKVKFLSIIYTIGLALVILLLFSTIVFGRPLGSFVFSQTGFDFSFARVWDKVTFIISFTGLFCVLIFIYTVLPNKNLSVNNVIPGAVFSSATWLLISYAFALYVNNFAVYSKLYGSIGGIIILLTWLYFSSLIILAGGEINAILIDKT